MNSNFYFNLDKPWTEVEYMINLIKHTWFSFTIGEDVHMLNLFDFLTTVWVMFSLCTVLFAFRHPHSSE